LLVIDCHDEQPWREVALSTFVRHDAVRSCMPHRTLYATESEKEDIHTA
jgi:hypothetical protein